MIRLLKVLRLKSQSPFEIKYINFLKKSYKLPFKQNIGKMREFCVESAFFKRKKRPYKFHLIQSSRVDLRQTNSKHCVHISKYSKPSINLTSFSHSFHCLLVPKIRNVKHNTMYCV